MQRKLTYFILFIGFLTISLFFACHKDNSISNQDKPDPNAAMNVDLAQSYYYNSLMKKPGTTIQTNLSVNSTGSSNAVPGEKNYKYLMFGLSHNSQTANVTYTEIPLRYNRRPSSVVANDDQTGDYASKLKILNASFDRLLIYKDKTTNQIDQAVVTYIPDADYLKRHNNDISGNQIDKLDPDFNGYLEYRKWDGSSMFLLKIADGKVVKDYIYKTGSADGTNKVQVNSTIKVNTIVCTPMYTQHWVQQCYATDPEGSNMVCGQWVLAGTDYWNDCHDDGSSSGPPLTGDPCHDYGYCGTPTPPTTPPVATINIPFKGDKIDPLKETKCFDKTSPAKMTIYVQQPNPNTRDMMGVNSVGHTFIGITQGGITRSFGFYPDSPTAAVMASQNSELHDNSGELYHVSISKDVTAAQLTNMINYINNYPRTYTLKSYNCTDFGIAVAAQGGLTLPATTGNTTQYGFSFSGRNPGDLGQDIRSMVLPAGTVRTAGQSHGPNKTGTCP